MIFAILHKKRIRRNYWLRYPGCMDEAQGNLYGVRRENHDDKLTAIRQRKPG